MNCFRFQLLLLELLKIVLSSHQVISYKLHINNNIEIIYTYYISFSDPLIDFKPNASGLKPIALTKEGMCNENRHVYIII